MKFDIVVPTLLGLEAFCSREIKRLGYEPRAEDGRVTFSGDEKAVAAANINLRTGERVLIKVGEFKAETFEELFENTKKLAWCDFLPVGCAFPVVGHSLKSTLASVPDCQKIIKKAVATSLGKAYGMEVLPEDGAMFKIRFSIRKDMVTLMIDTSGAPLYKRGYRTESNAAPLRETIAAAMVLLSFWKYETPLVDPFCGSGTILIEAAMFKNNIAPGINRSFAGEDFPYIPEDVWEAERDKARGAERKLPLRLFGSDIDPGCLEIAKNNAQRAGVSEYITFSLKDAADFETDEKQGAVICNPPYGERIGEKKECEELYKKLGRAFSKNKSWSYYILTSHEEFERLYGKKADKRRKVYNGMIKCNVYQYFGKE